MTEGTQLEFPWIAALEGKDPPKEGLPSQGFSDTLLEDQETARMDKGTGSGLRDGRGRERPLGDPSFSGAQEGADRMNSYSQEPTDPVNSYDPYEYKVGRSPK